VDEERHVDSPGAATREGAVEPPAGDPDGAWRGNGTRRPGGAYAYNGSGGYGYRSGPPASPQGHPLLVPPEGYHQQAPPEGYQQDQAEETWSGSGSGAAPEPVAEPLALLRTPPAATEGRYPGAPPPRYADPEPPPVRPDAPAQRYPAGFNDDTPVSGVSVVEPPLWRDAARHASPTSPSAAPAAAEPAPDPNPGYGAQLADYLAQGPVTGGGAPPPAAAPAESVGLPQRVPSEPDVPEVPGTGPGSRERWTARELAWIADRLRHDEVPQEPVERLDVDAIVEAVRGVPGVLSASVKANPNGVHRLRLDLADDADPGHVSRVVARMLEERMGLSAASQHVPPRPAAPRPAAPPPAAPRPAAPRPAAPRPAAPPPAAPPPGVRPASAPPVPDAPRGRALLAPPGPPTAAPPSGPERAPAQPSRTGPAAPEPAASPVPAGPARAAGPPEKGPPEQAPKPLPTQSSGPRVVIDHVRVSSVGLDATVEVLLTSGGQQSRGEATGPAVDSYVVRLAAVATANAIDELLHNVAAPVPQSPEVAADTTESGGSRCFVEHTGVVQFGETEVAVVVVLLLVCGGWVEQLTGSALVAGDPRQAMVRATLGAVNRRLEALLA
jgi:hypothetical protein